MTSTTDYEPPKVWTWKTESGGTWASINRPIAGPTHDKDLPIGKHPIQLYSLATPNGVKVTVMLEELLALGHTGAEYDAYVINIRDGDGEVIERETGWRHVPAARRVQFDVPPVSGLQEHAGQFEWETTGCPDTDDIVE